MNIMLVTYGSLLIAIICETIATSFLKVSEQFTKPVPTLIVAVGYVAAFYFLSVTLKTLPVGVAYAIWSGLGVVLVSVIGTVVFKQHLDLAAWVGMGLIIAGVVILNLFSKTAVH